MTQKTEDWRRKQKIDDWLGAMIGIVILLPCAVSVFVGALVVLNELLTWLKTATWVTPTLLEGIVNAIGKDATSALIGPLLHGGGTGWAGLDEILAKSLLSPLAWWLILIGPVTWAVCCGYLIGKIKKLLKGDGK
jgi:hypothetical protein